MAKRKKNKIKSEVTGGTENKAVFAELIAKDVTPYLEKKMNISYLSWAYAWEILKKFDPDFKFQIRRNEAGWPYFTDDKTCWVETSLTIKGETRSEMLAVMDAKNQAVPADTVTMVQVNKALKRCFVKNAALFGLGLNLWYKEELSEDAKEAKKEKEAAERKKAKKIDMELKAAREDILKLFKEKMESGVDKERLYEVVAKYTDGGKKNPNAIKSVENALACLEEIKKMTAEG